MNVVLVPKGSEMHPRGVRPRNEFAVRASEAEQPRAVEHCYFLGVFYFALCSLYVIAREVYPSPE